MPNYKFFNWPFSEGEPARIHWIASPRINPVREGRFCQVYLLPDSKDNPVCCKISWGAVPELWIGRSFMNGAPIDDAPKIQPITIRPTAIQNMEILRAADAIQPASLHWLFRLPDICNEYCVQLRYQDRIYIIPCMEVARSLYMLNSILANQLVAEGGLEDLIMLSTWEQNGSNVQFDFAPICNSVRKKKKFAEAIAALYGIPELLAGWKAVYANFVETGKIVARIPRTNRLEFKATGKDKDGITFITYLETHIDPPFRTVDYGPAEARNKEPSEKDNGRIILSPEGSEEITIGDASVSAKLGPARQIAGSHTGFSFKTPVISKRKKDDRTQPAGAKRMAVSDNPNTVYSINEPVGGGSAPSASLTSAEQNDPVPAGNGPAIDHDPDFPLFCRALEVLRSLGRIQVHYIHFYELPKGKTISLLGPPMNKPRRYAVAKVTTKRKPATWLIIELCLADSHSLSTLFVKVNPGQNSKELADDLIDKLLEANGHWSKRSFGPGTIHKTLDHWKGRSADRLAELILNKLLA